MMQDVFTTSAMNADSASPTIDNRGSTFQEEDRFPFGGSSGTAGAERPPDEPPAGLAKSVQKTKRLLVNAVILVIPVRFVLHYDGRLIRKPCMIKE